MKATLKTKRDADAEGDVPSLIDGNLTLSVGWSVGSTNVQGYSNGQNLLTWTPPSGTIGGAYLKVGTALLAASAAALM